jgi:hypothetical protein
VGCNCPASIAINASCEFSTQQRLTAAAAAEGSAHLVLCLVVNWQRFNCVPARHLQVHHVHRAL